MAMGRPPPLSVSSLGDWFGLATQVLSELVDMGGGS